MLDYLYCISGYIHILDVPSEFVMFRNSKVQFVPQLVVYKIEKDKFKLAFTEPQTPELIGVIFVGSDL